MFGKWHGVAHGKWWGRLVDLVTPVYTAAIKTSRIVLTKVADSRVVTLAKELFVVTKKNG